jgi:hypothetical protein
MRDRRRPAADPAIAEDPQPNLFAARYLLSMTTSARRNGSHSAK